MVGRLLCFRQRKEQSTRDKHEWASSICEGIALITHNNDFDIALGLSRPLIARSHARPKVLNIRVIIKA